MDRMFAHEAVYRGEHVLVQLGQVRILICGTGALGANLAESLARTGAKNLGLLDRDRVGRENLGTQPFGLRDVGTLKVQALANRLFRELGLSVKTFGVDLAEQNVRKCLQSTDWDLVVDTFDNLPSRRLLTEHCKIVGLSCLHAGMSPDGYSEVVWNERYTPPLSLTTQDICDYPLARSLVMFTVVLACEAILGFVADGKKQNFAFTLGDKAVHCF